MKTKLIILIMLILALSIIPSCEIVGATGEKQKQQVIPHQTTINVAGYNYDPWLPNPLWLINHSRGNEYFMYAWGNAIYQQALNDYTWAVDNQTYVFKFHNITQDILRHINEYSNDYDLLMIEGAFQECFRPFNTPLMKDIRKNLTQFILDEKGYIGHCGGASFALPYRDKPVTLEEWIFSQNSFLPDAGASLVGRMGWPYIAERFYHADKIGNRLLDLLHGDRIKHPEYMGTLGYLFYAPMSKDHFAAPPLNCTGICKTHPIFNDYLGNTVRIKWGQGPSLWIEDNNNITPLCYFPADSLSNNASQQLYAWSSPRLNMFENLELNKWSKDILDNNVEGIEAGLADSLTWHGDWKRTNTIIKPLVESNPAMIAFKYKNAGRVVLSEVHPEYNVWDDTNLWNHPDTNLDYLLEPDWYGNGSSGLYDWVHKNGSILTPNDLIEKSNYWLLRREAAWASNKVQNNSFPPVYGDSQVVDIEPLLQDNQEFLIKCCVGKYITDQWNTENLSLFYRYNGANSSYMWTNWKYYDSITGFPYHFTFNANQAKGNGRYEFCSILNTTSSYYNNGTWTTQYDNESFPPGPDAECGVGQSILSCFSYQPTTIYTNQTVHFSSASLTKSGTYINWYVWDFGDPPGMGGSALRNVTHNYIHPGVYTVSLTVTNNLSNTSTAFTNITIHDRPPEANFTKTPNHHSLCKRYDEGANRGF